MAEVIHRTWRSGHRKVRKTAWGYTYQSHGERFRKFDSVWSRQDAQEALAAAILERDVPKPAPVPMSVTLDAAAARYLRAKDARQKRSIRNDRMGLARLKAFFGEDTPLASITASRIDEYRDQRLTERSERLGRPVKPASLNKDLAILKHLLRLLHEWGYIDKVPKIKLEAEPEGRLRFLSEDEATRLLAKCHAAARTRSRRAGSPTSRPS